MSESNKVSTYFTRKALIFDSLYSQKEMSYFMRVINQRFRRDIYERYMLSLDYAQKQNTKTILDIGCGSGRYALGLSEIGVEKILGIDFSPKMIELAREYTKNVKDSNEIFEFICTDFMEFHTEDTYDLIIAMGFFDYIKDPVSVLRKMRILSNNSVIASFPSISMYRTPLRKIRYHFKRCPVYFFNPEMIKQFALEAGFSHCDITKIKGAGMDYFVVFSK